MGESIAEHVVGGVLYFLHGFDVAVDQQRRACWDKSPFTDARVAMRELCECRVLVVGTGGLGSAIARRFHALGAARVTGVRRRLHLAPPPAFDAVMLEALEAELLDDRCAACWPPVDPGDAPCSRQNEWIACRGGRRERSARCAPG
jgi:phosphoglycerate dehydrogenase-like enzyme